MRLSARNRIDPSEAEEVSDEVVLTWAPCAKHDKSYEVEMWDLGKKFFFFVKSTLTKKLPSVVLKHCIQFWPNFCLFTITFSQFPPLFDEQNCPRLCY